MAQRGRPSISKRQKELSRLEKRREKEERRARRRAERSRRRPADAPPSPDGGGTGVSPAGPGA